MKRRGHTTYPSPAAPIHGKEYGDTRFLEKSCAKTLLKSTFICPRTEIIEIFADFRRPSGENHPGERTRHDIIFLIARTIPHPNFQGFCPTFFKKWAYPRIPASPYPSARRRRDSINARHFAYAKRHPGGIRCENILFYAIRLVHSPIRAAPLVAPATIPHPYFQGFCPAFFKKRAYPPYPSYPSYPSAHSADKAG